MAGSAERSVVRISVDDRKVLTPMTQGLSRDQLDHFEWEGYVVVESALDPQKVIGPILREFEAIVNQIETSTRGHSARGTGDGMGGLASRLIELAGRAGPDIMRSLDISLPQSGVGPDTPFNPRPAVFDLLTNEGLVDIAESVVGPEILSCPVQHARMKLPRRSIDDNASNGLVGAVSWHQDSGVLLPEGDDSNILTIWIPLTDATIENGCLQVIPRSHATGEVFVHCPGGPGGLAIPDQLLEFGQPTPIPMKAGSVLLMTQRTVHSSLPNQTESEVRLSLDLRYQPIGRPTGRPAFDGAAFVARSSQNPESMLRSAEQWTARWLALRDQLALEPTPTFNRWTTDAPACA